MRSQLVGVEAVLADGSVLRHLSGLAKESAGYDLSGLLCGSEGTLGVVTRVQLRLIASAKTRVTAVVGTGSLAEALAVVAAARRSLPGTEAAEVVFADGVSLANKVLGVPSPLRSNPRCHLLVEIASAHEEAEAIEVRLGRVIEETVPGAETAVATDSRGRHQLWAVRERHPELVGVLGFPSKFDVSLPVGALARFERAVRDQLALRLPEAVPVLFGHLGDGGMHVNVATTPEKANQVPDVVLPLVASLGGSISAEHGIGIDKAPWLHLTRSSVEIAAMRRIKDAWDPAGLLNPGVLFG